MNADGPQQSLQVPTGMNQVLDFGCSGGHACRYELRAYSAGGFATSKAVGIVATPPSAPTSLSAEILPYSAGVLLKWVPPAHTYGLVVEHYGVEFSADNGRHWAYAPAEQDIAQALDQYIDTSCSAGETCMYKLNASTPAGPGQWSKTATAK